MKYVTVTSIYFEVKGHITLTCFPKVWHSSIKYYLRYKAKSLDPEKIGYCDLHLLLVKGHTTMSHHYDSLSHRMVVIHQILFKI